MTVFKKHYGGGGIPKIFLIDRAGKVVESTSGFSPGDENDLEKMVKKVL